MTREEIIEQVNSVLAEEFEVEDSNFAPDANVKETLALDSLSLVDLVAIIQYTYKIKVPVSDLPKIKTFNDLYDYIENHL
ncbi:MAG: acyl carrier protein [Prevotella sp.]|jgi:acyl carrier protein|nr:acyl carrier protein [Prevotella sp.]MBR4367932.1 acyl carrier protein [Prevotella sp.]MBR7049636.1 acyl carrier protein [Prevotella sp.]